MSGRRLSLVGVVAILGVAALGGFSSAASGQSPGTDRPGLVYGGERFGEPVWLRLNSSRDVIVALELPWAVNGKRCSNQKGYFSVLYAGLDYDAVIPIRPGGAFTKTVLDDYRYQGTRYVETQIVKGTVAGARVTGTIEGKVKQIRPNGQIVRCTFGPQRWSAVD